MTGIAEANGSLVEVSGVSRTFGAGSTAAQALRDVSCPGKRGEVTGLVGRSGSGKTTLLNIIGGLDAADAGSVRVAGMNVSAMGDRERTAFRRDTVAFIFQSFGLIPILSAAENTGVPLRIAGVPA